MKFLLFSANADTEQKVSKFLKRTQAAVLSSTAVEEAWQALQLHGASVDLAIIVLEGPGSKGEPGIDLIQKIKADSNQADLPIVVVTSKWSDEQCATHQASPQGANGYLKWPATDEQLKALIEGVIGSALEVSVTRAEAAPPSMPPTPSMPRPPGPPKATPPARTAAPPAASPPTAPTAPSAPPPPPKTESIQLSVAGLSPSLEDPSMMFSSEASPAIDSADPASPLSASIKLDAPDPSLLTASPGVALNEPSIQLSEAVADPSLQLAAPSMEMPALALPTSDSELSMQLEQGVSPSTPPAAPPVAPPVGSGSEPKQEGTLQIDINAGSGLELDQRDGPMASSSPPPVEISQASNAAGSVSALSMSGMGSQVAEPSQLQSILLGDALKPADAPPISAGPGSIVAPPPPSEPAVVSEAAPLQPPKLPEPEPVDAESEQQMPYLFGKAHGESRSSGVDALTAFAQPTGDAVVPGGAAQTPDMETLKKYLLLREQDVAALSAQLRSAKEQVAGLEGQLQIERAKSGELEHMIQQQNARIEKFEEEKSQALELLHSEAAELRFQVRAKADKAILLETQVRNAAEELEQIKKRVKMDIRKIRVREKELENRLEIMKKDSEALIGARESKIIELKRKMDLLEFNMDLLQDQHAKEKEGNQELRERLMKVAQAMRVAGGLIGQDASIDPHVQAASSSSESPTSNGDPERKAVS